MEGNENHRLRTNNVETSMTRDEALPKGFETKCSIHLLQVKELPIHLPQKFVVTMSVRRHSKRFRDARMGSGIFFSETVKVFK